MSICKIFAENLRRLRKERNLTQEDLAEKADLSGNIIHGYEVMRHFPSLETIRVLAKVLKVEEYKLFEMAPPPAVESMASVILTQEMELKNLRALIEPVPREILEALAPATNRKLDLVRAALGLSPKRHDRVIR